MEKQLGLFDYAGSGAIYRDAWPESAELYAGQRGPFPREGDKVSVLNLKADDEKMGTVIATDTRTRTYTVRFSRCWERNR